MFGQRGKVFDSIEHKRRVQRKLLEDYEARKDEFASYADFISRGASACAARPNCRRVGRDHGVAGEDWEGEEGGEGVVMPSRLQWPSGVLSAFISAAYAFSQAVLQCFRQRAYEL